jgi:hypothetical protein
MKLVETAQAQPVHTHAELAEIVVPDVVLDDVTPFDAQASAALDACNAGLPAALQFWIESAATAART